MKMRQITLWTLILACAGLWGVTPLEAAQKNQKKKPAAKRQAAKKQNAKKQPAKKQAAKKKPGHVRWADMPSKESKEYKRFDSNHDGKFDEAEKKRIQSSFRANPSDSYLMPYDRDDDKKLTDKEIDGIPPKEIDQKALEKMQKK